MTNPTNPVGNNPVDLSLDLFAKSNKGSYLSPKAGWQTIGWVETILRTLFSWLPRVDSIFQRCIRETLATILANKDATLVNVVKQIDLKETQKGGRLYFIASVVDDIRKINLAPVAVAPQPAPAPVATTDATVTPTPTPAPAPATDATANPEPAPVVVQDATVVANPAAVVTQDASAVANPAPTPDAVKPEPAAVKPEPAAVPAPTPDAVKPEPVVSNPEPVAAAVPPASPEKDDASAPVPSTPEASAPAAAPASTPLAKAQVEQNVSKDEKLNEIRRAIWNTIFNPKLILKEQLGAIKKAREAIDAEKALLKALPPGTKEDKEFKDSKLAALEVLRKLVKKFDTYQNKFDQITSKNDATRESQLQDLEKKVKTIIAEIIVDELKRLAKFVAPKDIIKKDDVAQKAYVLMGDELIACRRMNDGLKTYLSVDANKNAEIDAQRNGFLSTEKALNVAYKNCKTVIGLYNHLLEDPILLSREYYTVLFDLSMKLADRLPIIDALTGKVAVKRAEIDALGDHDKFDGAIGQLDVLSKNLATLREKIDVVIKLEEAIAENTTKSNEGKAEQEAAKKEKARLKALPDSEISESDRKTKVEAETAKVKNAEQKIREASSALKKANGELPTKRKDLNNFITSVAKEMTIVLTNNHASVVAAAGVSATVKKVILKNLSKEIKAFLGWFNAFEDSLKNKVKAEIKSFGDLQTAVTASIAQFTAEEAVTTKETGNKPKPSAWRAIFSKTRSEAVIVQKAEDAKADKPADSNVEELEVAAI